jgi:xanthine/uracil permease
MTGTAEGGVDRSSEWFVPKFGPPKFRIMVGLLFIPYTAMVVAFSVIGSMLARPVHWDRVLCIVVIYLLGLGVSAHALDAVGSKGQKPWGRVFSGPQLWLMAIISLVAAYVIGVYYMVLHVPWLSLVAVLEGFFVFGYNLEWFHGRFHTDGWFAFSWGFLPVVAGYIMQTNGISLEALTVALSMALFSVVEIKASRPYKAIKGRPYTLGEEEMGVMRGYEAVLKSISLGVVLLALGLVVWRLFE